MTMQTPAIAIPRAPRTPGRRLVIGLAAGAALALAAGVGLWDANRGRDATTVSQPTAPVERSVTTSHSDAGPTYFLVASQAQADTVQAGITDVNAIRAELGEPLLDDQVLVVSAADAGAAFWVASQEADSMRQLLGLVGATIVDLRQPTASTPALDPAAYSDQAMYSRWLAEAQSQQQADRVATEAARWSALGGADAPYATTPVSTCASYKDGSAC